MNKRVLIEDKLIYFTNFYSETQSRILFDKILSESEWNQDEIIIFGKKVKIPRLSSWYADVGVSYKYSGLELLPKTWSEVTKQIKAKIEEITGYEFNSLLLNYYRDGKDSMGWHSDDEKELGNNPIIASLTLGYPRRFLFRKKDSRTEKMEISLENGSLLMMVGDFQSIYEHSIPKTAKKIDARINLTFRKIIDNKK